ncbi:hypothetical protein Tco_1202599 [Tanacetum coccineum]
MDSHSLGKFWEAWRARVWEGMRRPWAGEEPLLTLGLASNAALLEYCDKYYHQLLPIIAEKVHQEKVQQEKLKEVKARLNFKGCLGRNSKFQEVSQHSKSRTPNVRGEHRWGRRPGRSCSMSKSPEHTSVFSRIRREGLELPRHMPIDNGRRNGGAFNRLGAKKRVCPHTRKAATRVPGQEERSQLPGSVTMKEHLHGERSHSQRVRIVGDDTESRDRKRKGQALRETTCLNHGSDDPEDHLKIFQAATKVERWAMLTWCHMFNYTLTGSDRKCIKDPVEIHHIKQREWESTEYFVQRFKNESRHIKGAPECMRISGFMHGITNPKIIKCLHENIPKPVNEMMRVTTTFLWGEVAASNQVRKKALQT